MKKTVAAILRTPTGSLIMQHRDNKPGIDYPDYITLFGGGCGADEDPAKAIIREIKEELDVDLQPKHLRLWRVYEKAAEKHGSPAVLHIFTYSQGINIEQLKVGEGQGFALISRKDDLSLFKMTNLAKQFIPQYFAEQTKAKTLNT